MKERRIKRNKLIRIMKIPARALARARDLYVRSMRSYAERGCYGGLGVAPNLGFQVVEPQPLPRCFTTSSSDLGRAAGGGLRLQGAPRSASVGMAKIDEDSPCEFGVDDHAFPRIRISSYAVRSTGFRS